MSKTVRIFRITYFEDDIIDGDITKEEVIRSVVPVEDVDEAVALIKSHGLTFSATGAEWAADPDGSHIIDYRLAEREEITAHRGDGWSDEEWIAVADAVDADD